MAVGGCHQGICSKRRPGTNYPAFRIQTLSTKRSNHNPKKSELQEKVPSFAVRREPGFRGPALTPAQQTYVTPYPPHRNKEITS